METGTWVLLRGYGGITEWRRVVGVEGDTVVICTDEEYRLAQEERRYPAKVVGVHRRDVVEERTDPEPIHA